MRCKRFLKMDPAPSPFLPPHHVFRGILFVDMEIPPRHHTMIVPLIMLVGVSVVLTVFGIVVEHFRRREPPAAAATLQHLSLPTDEPTSPDTSSDESEYQTRINMSPSEVELMPLARPVSSCPICMEPLVREMSTKCGHIFCKACIKAAVRVHGRCPMCKVVLTRRDLMRVYIP